MSVASNLVRLAGVCGLLALLCSTPLYAAAPEGRSASAQPIVGGEPAAGYVQPWMVALVTRAAAGATRPLQERERCGGTLIAPTWVLTAAHCVVATTAHELQVVIGRKQLDSAEGRVHDVAEVIVHPDYDKHSFSADIALLRLSVASAAAVLRLAPAGSTPALYGQRVALYGWGNTFDADNIACAVQIRGGNGEHFKCKVMTTRATNHPVTLLQTTLTLHDYATCSRRFAAYAAAQGLDLPDTAGPGGIDAAAPVLCAWDDSDLSAPCYGDSGGPLVAQVEGLPGLIGIVSYIQRSGCPLPFQIGYYTEVSRYLDFITQSMSRERVFALGSLCPGRPRPQLAYGEAHAGRRQVRLSWEPVADSVAYSIHVVTVPAQAAAPQSLRLGASSHDYVTELASKQHFLVSVQAHSASCDGPLSSVLELQVP